MTIFGRVLCPLQPSCLPPPHAARALLLCSFPLIVYPHFLLFSPSSPPPPAERNTFHPPLGFSFCSLCPLLLLSPLPSLLLILLLRCFVFSPQTHFFRSSSFSLLHPSLLLPLFFPFSLLPVLPLSPLSFPSRKRCTSRFTPLDVYREPGLLAPGLFWLQPCVPNQPCCMMHTCLKNH